MTSPRERVTIEDVARAAGVSRQTVSNVVNGRGRLSAPTRERVRRAIDALGYRPHRAASSLRSRRTRALAHPLAREELTPGNFVMTDWLQSLVAAAGARDHQMLMTAPGLDPVEQVRDLARSGSVDAVVFADVVADDERVAAAAALGLPFAAFGRTAPTVPQSWVDIDNRAALRTVVDHLVRTGHTRTAFIGYQGDSPWDLEREAGYHEGIEQAGLEPVCVRTVPGVPAAARVDELLTSSSRRPTAIVTGSDTLAATAYSVAGNLGLRVGEDVAVTGFDGGPLSRLLAPSLTTVTIPIAEIARRVIDRALAEVDGPTSRPGEVVPITLTIGGSAPGVTRV